MFPIVEKIYKKAEEEIKIMELRRQEMARMGGF